MVDLRDHRIGAPIPITIPYAATTVNDKTARVKKFTTFDFWEVRKA
jgi:hypothetical protein